MIYLYDGTLEGLLTVIFEIYSRKQEPSDILFEKKYQPSLFGEPICVETDSTKADRVADKIFRHMGNIPFRQVVYAFLSGVQGFEVAVYHYIDLGLEKGRRIDDCLADNSVETVVRIGYRVRREVHRMLGLLRFTELEDEVYYAPMEPDYPITPLMTPHFKTRMSDSRWVIHDVRHRSAVFWDKTHLHQLDISDEVRKLQRAYRQSIREEKDLYERLWRSYFKAISIKERENPKVQRTFMPQRYWTYLTEKMRA